MSCGPANDCASRGVPLEGRADALETECARLLTLGARRLRGLETNSINSVCIVVQDTEGSEFCLDLPHFRPPLSTGVAPDTVPERCSGTARTSTAKRGAIS
ncbi:VOC family protein [Micromonospora sp. CPCC 205558]|uniref:VOC family protein n=1 Tax=Micromonospora sp. CPCC 205558 TaxID=3122403 RepID=UPI003FA5AD92